jgi:hypothetical protein
MATNGRNRTRQGSPTTTQDAGEPVTVPQPPRPKPPVPVIAFALTAPFAVAAYLISAVTMEASLCPADTWKTGPLGSTASLQIGVFLIVLCVVILVIRTSTRIAGSKLSAPFALMRTIAKNDYYCATMLLYSLLGMAVAWVNYWESYFCIGTQGIIARTGIISRPRTATWDDVQTALAQCAITKSGLAGTLTITLDDGVIIPLKLKSGTTTTPGDFAPIRGALRGHHYLFGMAPSVTQETCPPALYQAFTTWQD